MILADSQGFFQGSLVKDKVNAFFAALFTSSLSGMSNTWWDSRKSNCFIYRVIFQSSTMPSELYTFLMDVIASLLSVRIMQFSFDPYKTILNTCWIAIKSADLLLTLLGDLNLYILSPKTIARPYPVLKYETSVYLVRTLIVERLMPSMIQRLQHSFNLNEFDALIFRYAWILFENY